MKVSMSGLLSGNETVRASRRRRVIDCRPKDGIGRSVVASHAVCTGTLLTLVWLYAERGTNKDV